MELIEDMDGMDKGMEDMVEASNWMPDRCQETTTISVFSCILESNLLKLKTYDNDGSSTPRRM